MTTTLPLPPTGLCLWALVYPLRSHLNARVPLPSTVVGIDADVLLVAVGSSPYRLMAMWSGDDGLIRLQLWRVGKSVAVEFDRTVMSDLVPDVLRKMSAEFQLTA